MDNEYGEFETVFYLNPEFQPTQLAEKDNVIRILSLFKGHGEGTVVLAEEMYGSDERFNFSVDGEDILVYKYISEPTKLKSSLQLARNIAELPITAGHKLLDLGSKVVGFTLPGTVNGR